MAKKNYICMSALYVCVYIYIGILENMLNIYIHICIYIFMYLPGYTYTLYKLHTKSYMCVCIYIWTYIFGCGDTERKWSFFFVVLL